MDGPSPEECRQAIERHVTQDVGECRINPDGTVTTANVVWTKRIGGRQCNTWKIERCSLGHLHVTEA